MRTRFFPLLLIPLVVLPAQLRSQVVRGQLLNGETGLPLEGAMMVLLRGTQEESMVLTNAMGRFIIRAPRPGAFTVRADRIGHASTVSEAFNLSPGDTVDLRMVAEVRAIQLEGLEISGEARCDIRPEAGRAVATVWEEARKALAAAALTEEAGVYRYRIIRFVRDLDKNGRRVLADRRTASQGYLAVPFESLPADALISQGFIRPDPGGDLYFAPDANVLLSDPFLDTHCLGLTAGEDETSGLVGVTFEPVSGRDLPEIRGVVWVDPGSGELSHVDYTYDNLDPALRSEAVGGKVVFQGLPDGTWIVTEWRIRMPSAALSSDFRGGRQMVLAGIREVGGEVDRVRDRRGQTVLEASRATLTGVVMDSTGGAPLTGARVELMGTGQSTLTDSVGAFRISGISEGVYAVGFSHPDVPMIGKLPEPQEVELTSGEVRSVRMVAPPLSEILAAACPDVERPEGSAVLTGVVRRGDTGDPLSGVTVRVRWSDFRFHGTEAVSGRMQTMMGVMEDGLEGRTDRSGRYLACAVPGDHPLRLEAETEEMAAAVVDIRVPQGQPLLSRDLTVVEGANGTVVGLVLDFENRSPLDGVRVRLRGQGREAVTNDDGRFVLTDLPLGRQVLQAEMLGRRTLTDTVRIRPGDTLQLEIRLPSQALEIEGISVEVLSRNEMGFRQEGFSGGRFDQITPEEMDVIRDRVTDIVDVIRRTGSPRIRVTDYTTGGVPMGFCIRWTRRELSQGGALQRSAEAGARGTTPSCTSMLVVVDGMPQQDVGGSGPTIPATEFLLDLSPEDIESVRVISPVQARFQYGAMGDRGALIIETRRGGEPRE